MPVLDAEPPHRRYYLACVGRWGGAFVIESIDRLVWLGAPMQQTTRLDDEGLDLVQRTAFSTARVRLRRL